MSDPKELGRAAVREAEREAVRRELHELMALGTEPFDQARSEDVNKRMEALAGRVRKLPMEEFETIRKSKEWVALCKNYGRSVVEHWDKKRDERDAAKASKAKETEKAWQAGAPVVPEDVAVRVVDVALWVARKGEDAPVDIVTRLRAALEIIRRSSGKAKELETYVLQEMAKWEWQL